jgi:hypothetical protein
MKWFKHLSGSLNNSTISESIELFGPAGYLVFFGILEMISDEFDPLKPGKIILRMKKITRNLQLSRQKTVRILSFFDQKAKNNPNKYVGFFVEVDGDTVSINCPRLKELSDEYTQKQLKTLSGVNPDSVGSKSRIEEEVDKDIDINKKERVVKKDKEEFVLPDWIPEETWQAYMGVRNRKKASKTTYALNLIIKELVKIKTKHGHDPIDVLNKSIQSGWPDVYPLKENNHKNTYKKPDITDHNMSVIGEFLERHGEI